MAGWPIAERGEDLEQAEKQRQAADLLNLRQLEIAKQKAAKRIAAAKKTKE